MNAPPDFEILHPLGAGGTCEVHAARQRSTGLRVALKIARPDLPNSAEFGRRLRTEWLIGRELRHPYLVQVHAYGQLNDGRGWLAMELLEGLDLSRLVHSAGPLGVGAVIRTCQQVALALGVLHRRGAVHRDVKPENIFMVHGGPPVGHAKLLDLGIARLSDDDPRRAHQPTARGIVVGTALYVSPEQALGMPPGPSSDIYSLGVTLFELLAGRTPFHGASGMDLMRAHVKDAPPALAAATSGLPSELCSLVDQCLAKRPEERPKDMDALAGALEAALQVVEWDNTATVRMTAEMMPPFRRVDSVASAARFRAAFEDWQRFTFAGTTSPVALRDGLVRLDALSRRLADAEGLAAERRSSADRAAADRLSRRAAADRTRLEVLALVDAAQSQSQVVAGEYGAALAAVDEAERGFAAAVGTMEQHLQDQHPATRDTWFPHLTQRIEVEARRRATAAQRLDAVSARVAEAADRSTQARAQLQRVHESLLGLDAEDVGPGAAAERTATGAAIALEHARHALAQQAIRLVTDGVRSMRR